jgi:hypothetical protein
MSITPRKDRIKGLATAMSGAASGIAVAAGDWDESKHPRGKDGKFGEGGGGGSKGPDRGSKGADYRFSQSVINDTADQLVEHFRDNGIRPTEKRIAVEARRSIEEFAKPNMPSRSGKTADEYREEKDDFDREVNYATNKLTETLTRKVKVALKEQWSS